jgi:predicted kinase
MALKSAYDLAMEKLAAKLPQTGRKLTRAQKAKLARLDSIYTAKIAECELELKPKITAARAKGDTEAAQKLEETLRAEIAKLRNRLEEEKEAVRRGQKTS